jgi:hypothetical protein
VQTLDYSLLKTVKALVADREVGARSLYDWEKAILAGYRVWRLVREHDGGIVIGDLMARCIDYRPK